MLSVKVWGDLACFTRPEHKVERVSYDVMTPSAARGILEAIAWKPEYRWRVHEIWVLNPIRRHAIVRNEVKRQASSRTARGWEGDGGGYRADEDRTQRYSLLLRDVAYVIQAEIELMPHATDPVSKYRDIFRRRVKKGQSFAQPYLGNREFTAFFGPPETGDTPIDVSDDLGRMLFDIEYEQVEKGPVRYRSHDAEGATWVDGRATPRFFSARLERGVLEVPQDLYETVA